MNRRQRALLLGTVLVAGAAPVVVPPMARAAATCAVAEHAGGEWRNYGRDLTNQRNQRDETTLNPSTVANVAKAWSFDAGDPVQSGVLGGAGAIQNTPVIADGCAYISTSGGFVFALNADTGERVWASVRLPGSSAGSLVGGVITGSPAVENGLVYVAVSNTSSNPNDPNRPSGPFIAALDQATGAVRWLKSVIDPLKFKQQYRMTVVAAPVVWNGLIFQGIMADENSEGARGGYAILDAFTGALLHQDFTISDAEYAAGYRGASIWCTAAVDAETGYAYACGGNPASKQIEARYSNSLLKIDLDRNRSTFGKIVGAYKGTTDQYYPGLDRQPACDRVPTNLVWSPTCVQMDLDFGSSPSLFTVNVAGQKVKMVGDLQKAGIYHAVFADNMQAAWTTVVGAPGPTWNASSPAADDGHVYVVGTPASTAFSLTNAGGRYRWATPIPTGSGLYFESVSVANGVLYAIDNTGTLTMLDTATGLPAKHLSLAADMGEVISSPSSHGVAIARNTVYAAAATYVVAYR